LWLAAITVIVLVTMCPGGFTPWKYIFYLVPGANAIRSVSRIAVLFLIPLCIGFAFLIDRFPPGLALSAVLICFVEQGRTTESYDKVRARNDVAALAARISTNCTAFYYSPAFGDV